MHGREGEERRGRRSCNWHMRTVPTRVGVAVAPDADGSSSSSASSSPNFFHKVLLCSGSPFLSGLERIACADGSRLGLHNLGQLVLVEFAWWGRLVWLLLFVD